MFSVFLHTFWGYAVAIVPWFAVALVLAYFTERRLNPQIIKKYFGKATPVRLVLMMISGMLSPLSIMTALPILGQLTAMGGSPALLLSYVAAERAYDLQSFFIIAELFNLKIAILSATIILVSLVAAAYAIYGDAIKMRRFKKAKKSEFWQSQAKLLGKVLAGIALGAALKAVVPSTVLAAFGSGASGFIAGITLGLVSYVGPIMSNYPLARTYADLGLSHTGVMAFLVLSPLFNVVIITLFAAAAGLRTVLKFVLVYSTVGAILTIAASPWL